MLSRNLSILITALAAFAIDVRAAEFSLSVESAVAYATRHNPALAAARLRIEEARGRVDAAGLRPNPELEWEVGQNIASLEHGFAVTWVQKFPRTARLALEKSVSQAEVTAAAAEVWDAERLLAGEVRATAVALLALEKERSLRKQQIAASDELAAFLTKRVQTGEASALDSTQVELETRQLGTQILMHDVEKAKLLGSLRPLLGVSPTSNVRITGNLAEPGPHLDSGGAISSRGDYRAAQAKTEAARRNVELTRVNTWDDIIVGVSAERTFADDAGVGIERELTVGIKVTMPIPLRNKNEGKIREAGAALKRTELEIEAVALQARAEVEAARAEMAALGKIIAGIDRDLVPQTRKIEEQLNTAYTAGQIPLTEVIRARGKRFELEAQRLKALRDYNLALAKHKTATGGDMSKQK